LSVNGTAVNSKVEYNEEMKKYLPGNTVTLKIKRDQKSMNVSVVLD